MLCNTLNNLSSFCGNKRSQQRDKIQFLDYLQMDPLPGISILRPQSLLRNAARIDVTKAPHRADVFQLRHLMEGIISNAPNESLKLQYFFRQKQHFPIKYLKMSHYYSMDVFSTMMACI